MRYDRYHKSHSYPAASYHPLSSVTVIFAMRFDRYCKLHPYMLKLCPLSSADAILQCDLIAIAHRLSCKPISTFYPFNPIAFAPPVPISCPCVNPRSQWFSSRPICQASPNDCDRSPLYDFHSPPKAVRYILLTAHFALISPMYLSCLMAVESICWRSNGSRLFAPASA